MAQKIYLRFLALIIATVLCTSLCVTLAYYALFERKVHQDMQVTAQIFKDTEFFDTADVAALEDNPKLMDANLRVTLIDTDGTVLFDNTVNAEQMDNHANRPEIVSAMETGAGEIERQSDTMGLKDYYYALRLNDGRILRIAQEVDAVWVVFASGLPLCLGLILLISFVCVLASRILTRQLMKPIEDVAGKLNDDFVDSPYPELYPFISKIRKQHEEVLAAAKVRQDFSANVSHELKTPLTAISGYAQLLGSDDTPPEKRKHFADEIDKNANRLLALIEDIIKLSELDSDDNDEQFETVDLYELAAEELDSLTMAASQRNIDITLSGTSTSVRCRPDLIRELIDNLVQNSIRYGNDGGHVAVSVLEEYGYKKLIVEDDGIGIPADDLDRVFERFYRVDKSRSKASGGTGLGLAIVKHIVEIHDAKIQIESELGAGTKVTVLM